MPELETSRWAPALNSCPQPRLRLFCFPYAGGGIPVYRAWPAGLPHDVEVRVVQLPGRGTRFREPAFTRMEPLVDALQAALDPLLDRPFAFFGHSLGALVAFEFTRRLHARRIVPLHLFVSAKDAPHVPDLNPRLHQLSDSALLRELGHLNGMPQAVLDSPELLEIVLPIVRADFTVLENYAPGPVSPLECPILAFGGHQDPRTSLEGLEAWRLQTTQSFRLVTLPGDHFFIDSHRTELLASISRALSHQPGPVARPARS